MLCSNYIKHSSVNIYELCGKKYKHVGRNLKVIYKVDNLVVLNNFMKLKNKVFV